MAYVDPYIIIITCTIWFWPAHLNFTRKDCKVFCAREVIFSGNGSKRDDEETVCALMTLNFFPWNRVVVTDHACQLKWGFFIDNNQNGTYVVPCRIPLEPWISLSRPAWEYGSDFISWQAFSNRSAAFSITPKDLGISFFNLESWDEAMVSLPTRIRLVTALE